MPDTREEAQGTDGLENDDADIGAARGGDRENETDHEDTRGGVDHESVSGHEPRKEQAGHRPDP